VVVTLQQEQAVLIDGFKRLRAARQLRGMKTLTARRVELDERGAKAALFLLNQTGRRTKEEVRHEIVRRWREGQSMRGIAQDLNAARKTVKSVIQSHQRQREEGIVPPELSPRKKRRSQLDEHEDALRELLTRYPNITVTRLLEELRDRGYRGGYTVLRQRVNQLRPRKSSPFVERFETSPAQQAQMDYAVYDLDFTHEGRRRVNLFGYILGYSRRQYLRFVESQDMETTLREHVRAFEHLGGVAATCLYDNMKVVVARYEDEEPTTR
jgi:transposase